MTETLGKSWKLPPRALRAEPMRVANETVRHSVGAGPVSALALGREQPTPDAR